MSLKVDSIISGRYHLQRLIATGGMGQVWEALDTRLDRKVAVKVLKAEYSNNPEFLNRFRVEAKTTAALNNPGIAGVFDYGETPDESVGEGTLAYLVMELVYGEPLSTRLSREKVLSVDNTLDILEQTATALQSAHSVGFVHRDVKPGNILITENNEIKITDFGIAKAADAAPLTQSGTVMGTAQYISPEQARGLDATSASDVYALAVVGYESLSGKRPFIGDSPVSIAMQHIQKTPPPLPEFIPESVKELLAYALEKDPKKRYRDGAEFAQAIRKIRIGTELSTPESKRSKNIFINSLVTPKASSRISTRILPNYIENATKPTEFNNKIPNNFDDIDNDINFDENDDPYRKNFSFLPIVFALIIISFALGLTSLIVYLLQKNNESPKPSIRSSSVEHSISQSSHSLQSHSAPAKPTPHPVPKPPVRPLPPHPTATPPRPTAPHLTQAPPHPPNPTATPPRPTAPHLTQAPPHPPNPTIPPRELPTDPEDGDEPLPTQTFNSGQ